MKKIIIVTILMLISSYQISLSQDKQQTPRFSKPLYDKSENNRVPIGPPISLGDYPFLPYPYANYDISNDSTPQNEPSLKFSGKYPNIVVGAWRDFRTGVTPAIRRVGYSYSTNAGTSWSVSALTPITDATHPRTSDAVVCSDSAGNFYIATISIDINNANGILLIYKSTDGGVTFPVSYNAGSPNEDKEWIACDLTHGSSPYKNNLYISWTSFSTPYDYIEFTKSTNGGVNWSNRISVSHESGVQGSDLAIGPNGEIYVVWVGGFTDDIIYFNKSIDGGTTFMATDGIAGEGASPSIPISTSGVTFPSIATDVTGGPRNGYIYVTWCDARNGDPDIFLSRSTDAGATFSTAVRVNNDAVSNGKLQCWHWIAVNEVGNIAILYYDSRNTASNTIIEAWLARSTDGGQTFVNERLSSVPSPTNQPNSDVRFGDYINVDYRGTRIAPIWTDERAGGYNTETYSAVIDLATEINQISGNIPIKFELSQNYPNPFNPVTQIKYQITNNSFVNLIVYDILGKEVATLVNKNQTAGTYEVKFDASKVSSGVYFYKLISGSFSDIKKMTVVK